MKRMTVKMSDGIPIEKESVQQNQTDGEKKNYLKNFNFTFAILFGEF